MDNIRDKTIQTCKEEARREKENTFDPRGIDKDDQEETCREQEEGAGFRQHSRQDGSDLQGRDSQRRSTVPTCKEETTTCEDESGHEKEESARDYTRQRKNETTCKEETRFDLQGRDSTCEDRLAVKKRFQPARKSLDSDLRGRDCR